MKEQDLQKQILDYLRHRGILCWKVPLGPMLVGGGMRTKNPMSGHPDVAAVLKGGRYLAIEVKRDSGASEVSEAQRDWLARLGAQGAICGVVRGIPDVEDILALAEDLGAA